MGKVHQRIFICYIQRTFPGPYFPDFPDVSDVAESSPCELCSFDFPNTIWSGAPRSSDRVLSVPLRSSGSLRSRSMCCFSGFGPGSSFQLHRGILLGQSQVVTITHMQMTPKSLVSPWGQDYAVNCLLDILIVLHIQRSNSIHDSTLKLEFFLLIGCVSTTYQIIQTRNLWLKQFSTAALVIFWAGSFFVTYVLSIVGCSAASLVSIYWIPIVTHQLGQPKMSPRIANYPLGGGCQTVLGWRVTWVKSMDLGVTYACVAFGFVSYLFETYLVFSARWKQFSFHTWSLNRIIK